MTEATDEGVRYEVRDAGGLVLLVTPDRGAAEREAGRVPGATITERRRPGGAA